MNIPKEDGYYWYKDEDGLTIVKVNDVKYYNREWSLDCSRVYFMAEDVEYQLHEMKGEFLSKIIPPEVN